MLDNNTPKTLTSTHRAERLIQTANNLHERHIDISGFMADKITNNLGFIRIKPDYPIQHIGYLAPDDNDSLYVNSTQAVTVLHSSRDKSITLTLHPKPELLRHYLQEFDSFEQRFLTFANTHESKS